MDAYQDSEIEASRAKLLAQFSNSPDLVFIRAWGNIGDDLIYAGTRQLLANLDYREVSIRDLGGVSGHTALVCGSGGWCKPFHAMPSFLPVIEERFESVIILPSSFDPEEPTVRAALANTKALVFARELVSYDNIRGLCRCEIAHDCAFFFKYDAYRRQGTGILNVFRLDADSTYQVAPEDNNDISATCSGLDEWLWTIARHDLIRTDRAHILIAGAMLGKRVEYDTTSYHKVPAIAAYALKGYPVSPITRKPVSSTTGARIERAGTALRPTPPERSGKSRVARFADFAAERAGWSHVIFTEDLRSLDWGVEYPRDSIVVIPNAGAPVESLAQVAGPLRGLVASVGAVFLLADRGVVPNSAHLTQFLRSHGVPVEFAGYVNEPGWESQVLAVLSSTAAEPAPPTPADFRVVALISSFNEEDIIVPAIRQSHANGVGVYLIDNWSTDSTFEKAQALRGAGIVGLERFPEDGPSPTFDWKEILKRKEEVSSKLDADWFIHQDMDDVREAPWEQNNLRDAIYRVQQNGFNAIDFTVLNFHPVDNGYAEDSSFVDYFRYCEFGKHAAYFQQIQAWRKTADRIHLHESGGHSAEFDGRKVFPYKFLLRHYPIRSQLHGERKIFRERVERVNLDEKRQGWNYHYHQHARGESFLKNPAELVEFKPSFYADYMLERLSGIGIRDEEVRAPVRRKDGAAAARAGQPVSGAASRRARRRMRSLTARLRRKQRHVRAAESRLRRQRGALQQIYGSRSWRLVQAISGLRRRLAPPGSPLVRLLRSLFRSP